MESTSDLAKRWLDLDKDSSTRREIQDLVQANNVDELELRLRHRIAFGTAGLRASMKAGFAHMNSVTVIQASQGLAQYVLDQPQPHINGSTDNRPRVVIGFDARHNSENFARLTAAAFLAKGFSVLWFGQPTHTPMVPFCVNRYGAAAGVMVTASHNPKEDNGYKVYWSNGCQIISPHDLGIAKAIESEQAFLSWDTEAVDRSQLVKNVFGDAEGAYLESIQLLLSGSPDSSDSVDFVYTPMHGVGLQPAKRLAKIMQLEHNMRVVPSQAEPDPEFPTVPFPNPEEKGALNLAKAEAERRGCSLIIANDPDADRFTAAEKLPSGEWHQFTGNQMGILLASHVLEEYAGDKASVAMLASTVSSRMLASMAEAERFHFQETLTGFKWLGNIGQQLEQQGYTVLYAYEEAIGYMFPTVVWDKDGIVATGIFLSACRKWKKQGLTPWKRLQQLYETYGYFEDANTYLISPSPDTTNKVFNGIRALNNGSRPQTIGSRNIIRWRDLTLGYDSATKDNKPDLPVDASAQMITCELDDVVFTARGSGTEPKIKLYIEARGASSREAKERAEEALGALLSEWFKPEYGLKLAGT